jgi:PPOX class probable F420-dependent enzyme
VLSLEVRTRTTSTTSPSTAGTVPQTREVCMAQIPDSHRHLLDTPTAVLGTIGPDGRPQMSLIWFLADGDVVRTSLSSARQKTKNLLRNPAVDLLIADPANPAVYLELRGDAELEPDPDYRFADQLAAKYGGMDLRALDGPGDTRYVVTIRPVRTNAVDMTAH